MDKPEKCCDFGEHRCDVVMPIDSNVKSVDYCISHIVAALNAGGIKTLNSCCGHGKAYGSIILDGGDELILKKADSIQSRILEVAKNYSVTVVRNKDYDSNTAGCAGNEIFLGYFHDPDIELIAFFHELGHAMIKDIKTRDGSMSKISEEGMAWEYGLCLALDNGYVWEYDSKEMVWARNQLMTYAKEVIDKK